MQILGRESCVCVCVCFLRELPGAGATAQGVWTLLSSCVYTDKATAWRGCKFTGPSPSCARKRLYLSTLVFRPLPCSFVFWFLVLLI